MGTIDISEKKFGQGVAKLASMIPQSAAKTTDNIRNTQDSTKEIKDAHQIEDLVKASGLMPVLTKALEPQNQGSKQAQTHSGAKDGPAI